jgi:hypothetical protein
MAFYQSSAGRPQAGDAKIVQWVSRISKVVNVHAVFSAFPE